MNVSKDSFGPEYVLRVHDGKLGMTGYLVIDNTTLGPGKGGIRMTPGVTEDEVFRLARTMTWKNALAGIPFGGAKAGLVIPEGIPPELKKQFVQSFARALKPFIPGKYIAGPDVNSGEKEMQWCSEAVGMWEAATGKPANFCAEDIREGKKPRKATGSPRGRCGLPHELGSTGFGVAHAAKVAAEVMGLQLRGATVAIEGFGNVGTFSFKFLKKMGAKIVAVSDSRGTAYLESGLDFAMLHKLKAEKKSVADYAGALQRGSPQPSSGQAGQAKKLSKEELFGLPVDILIPAAVTDVINDSNKNSIKAKLIVEGANICMRESTENELFKRGMVIVPDFVANAGGVISSYPEYRGMSPEEMFKLVEERITHATREVMEKSIHEKRNPREMGMEIARKKIE